MVEVWTDGSCLGNPGKGGWAFLAKTENNTFESSGGEKFTTNNKMELTAVIKALEYLKENNIKNVKFNLDSQYVKNGIEIWINNWKKNNWKTADKKEVKNKELWIELDDLAKDFNISWNWVRGHDGNQNNEIVDKLARLKANNQ